MSNFVLFNLKFIVFFMVQIPQNIFPTDSLASDSAPATAAAIKSLTLDDLLNRLVEGTVQLAISVAIAIAVFYVGKFIIRKLHMFVGSVLLRRNVDASLSTFILSLIRIVLFFILIVTVIGILGINTSSFLALFASAGVAIGMALSGTLQNFAGGVLILLLKPYKIGDYIEAQGYAGRVMEIQIFSTIICTPDNKSIIIPNGGLSTGSINNWSREKYRRVEWEISISYGDDVEAARKLILDMFNSDRRIIKGTHSLDNYDTANDPEDTLSTHSELERKAGFWKRLFSRRDAIKANIEAQERMDRERLRKLRPAVDRTPTVRLGSLADSAVVLSVRAWVLSDDYWGVFYDYNELFYTRLPECGISFPFPQLDVHIAK